MNRAHPLPPKERRRALIEATLPLIRQHGADVSTRQIAEAAGVAEGTIFRVFSSKTELIDAAIEDAMSPDRLQSRLNAAASGQPLDAQVRAIVGVLEEHAQDARLIFAVLGRRPHKDADDEARRPSHAEMNARVTSTITDLLAPHADALAVDPASAARLVLALSFGSVFTFPDDIPVAAPLVSDALLHGIAKEI